MPYLRKVNAIKKIGFLTAFMMPALLISGYYGGGYWNYITILFSFVLIPAIDQFAGWDTSNVPKEEVEAVSHDRYYQVVLYAWSFVQLGLFVWLCLILPTGLGSWQAWFGFTLSFSLVTGGIGITVAHELGHKKSATEKFFSNLLLMTVCYMHFYIEHNKGHHVWVATPHDPATARKNENFYAFWIRTVTGSYRNAWKLETQRLIANGLPAMHWGNQMIWFTLLPLIFCAALTLVSSLLAGSILWWVPIFFFAQSALAFTLLELVNYVEHYGILRKEISPGRFEKVNPLHSWNASNLVSNFFLFQLQRHSDHHFRSSKRYQVLDHFDESPQLPFGYPTMILMALIPPLWFTTMNHRLELWASKIYPHASPS